MNSLPLYHLLLIFLLIKSPFLKPQSLPNNITFSPRFLDSQLQDYAFRSFVTHRTITGKIYGGNVASTLTGITVSAVRLRSGALIRKGYFGYKEFNIPVGVFLTPYVTRVVLVYQNLGNWSKDYYPLPGYLFLTPVVGILAYNASYFPAKRLPELNLRSSENPIMIKFESFGVLANGVVPKCVSFDLFGEIEFDHVVNGSVCLTVKEGHFGVVVEESAPAPENGLEEPIAVGSGGGDVGNGGEWWVGGVVGGGVMAGTVVMVMVWVVRRWRLQRMEGKMECAAEGGAPLSVAAVGNVMVPVAMQTRTKPILENEYVL
ncbi:uncharacterized protein [Rutidosis leptorrhynchoides]|uniref:uncharacterized protein n=1 Tax=Rutidosis leptorrhynchoides TaxID=125765 RepID=UPI003A99D498